MSPELIQISTDSEYSFSIKHELVPYFYNQWHYHPEIELTLIIRGTGARFMGDDVDTFKDDDLILIGPNLPHLFKNDDKYYKTIQTCRPNRLPYIFCRPFLEQRF